MAAIDSALPAKVPPTPPTSAFFQSVLAYTRCESSSLKP